MLRIAVVEDDPDCRRRLLDYIKRFESDTNEKFDVVSYENAILFCGSFRQSLDIVFMDVLMPNMSGMEAAAELRKVDKQAVLIFVTSTPHFAIKGYEVGALSYILKPINYNVFVQNLNKAIAIVRLNADSEFVIAIAAGLIKLSIKELIYVEVAGHKLVFHSEKETLSRSGTLSDIEQKLKGHHFMRCNACYLVNPKHIKAVDGFSVVLRNGESLQISHPKKAQFMAELAAWLGGGNST
jgi:DNA-binding LytR/AlgR family response regulator